MIPPLSPPLVRGEKIPPLAPSFSRGEGGIGSSRAHTNEASLRWLLEGEPLGEPKQTPSPPVGERVGVRGGSPRRRTLFVWERL